MAIEFMFITNKPQFAQIADRYGVDWIFIDLETVDKTQRQSNKPLLLSDHKISDIHKIKNVLKTSRLLVRVNHIYSGSKKEIEEVINAGTDMIMLPYFKTVDEVKTFIDVVDGRAQTCLLFETKEAVENIDDILRLDGIDALHIGLNDLTLSYNMRYVFEPLACCLVEDICAKFKESGKKYGFGGIARLGCGELPADYVIAEHYRLGSRMAILSRSFFSGNREYDSQNAEDIFKTGIGGIRLYEKELESADASFFERNHSTLKELVDILIKEGWRI